jgi:hypothetical protein
MRRSEEMEQGVAAPEPVGALPEHTWRAVGWIFRDGACVAIERQGSEIRRRVVAE